MSFIRDSNFKTWQQFPAVVVVASNPFIYSDHCTACFGKEPCRIQVYILRGI